jgi:alpha-galactosidase
MKTPRPLISAVLALAAGGLAGQGAAPAPPTQAPEATAAAILTPPSPPTPRINGPRIFGVRPGDPFLFSIPASGSRPMRFSAADLPPGLALDPATGRITGALGSPGEFTVTLRAENALGADERPLRIVAGQAIALTPPLGWNSWNCWGKEVSQEKVLRSARAMVAAGLDQHGWAYINIDDGWQGLRTGAQGALEPNGKFPDMAALADAIHAMGLKFGIYSTPWTKSYAGFLGGSSENPDGRAGASFPVAAPRNGSMLPYAMGRYGFAARDARQWAAWGVDYLKYDWGPVDVADTAVMAAALRATGRDIVLSLSNNGAGNILGIVDGLAPLAQSWRTTNDINDTWSRVVAIGFSQGPWAPHQSPGHYNDADMLVVGHVGWGVPHPTRLTPDEQYTHISLWCLLGTPLLIGCDLEKLDPFTIGLLTNDEVLAVDQDALCRPATRVSGDGDLQVYAKPLEDGSWAVGLFNLGPNEATVTARWQDLGAPGPKLVRDLWRQRDVGTFGGGYGARVAPHGVVLLRVSASGNTPIGREGAGAAAARD